MAAADVVFHPGASEDYVEAIGWYADREPTIALRFEVAISAAVDAIRAAPRRWRSIDVIHRRVPVHRFPYAVVYREHAGHIWIVAIAHGRRRPGFWRTRRPDRA